MCIYVDATLQYYSCVKQAEGYLKNPCNPYESTYSQTIEANIFAVPTAVHKNYAIAESASIVHVRVQLGFEPFCDAQW